MARRLWFYIWNKLDWPRLATPGTSMGQRRRGQKVALRLSLTARFSKSSCAHGTSAAARSVALNGRLMIMNATAGALLNPAERPRLWKVAKDAIGQGSPQIRELRLSHGKSVMASHRPVVKDGTAIGVIVQFSAPGTSPAPRAISEGVSRDPAGWADLTRTERQVAQVVAGGLTNREAGRRVFMSPHTVDAHLRHIFRKLDINSRVELARIVGEQEPAPGRRDAAERGGAGVQWSRLAVRAGAAAEALHVPRSRGCAQGERSGLFSPERA